MEIIIGEEQIKAAIESVYGALEKIERITLIVHEHATDWENVTATIIYKNEKI